MIRERGEDEGLAATSLIDVGDRDGNRLDGVVYTIAGVHHDVVDIVGARVRRSLGVRGDQEPHLTRGGKIGRASSRETVWMSEGAGSLNSRNVRICGLGF